MKTYSYILMLILLMFFAACQSGDEKKAVNASLKIDEGVPVRIAVADSGSFTRELVYTGTFFANKEANLGSSIPGRIEKFHYPPGTFVKEGSLLVELSAEVLTKARIEYNAIKNDYERISRLMERGSISRMEYDHIKAKLDASKVQTEMLEKNTNVTAPFDGVIVEYLVEEGENYFFSFNFEPGYSHTSGILRLMQLNPVKAVVEVNESDLKYISKGAEVRVYCDAIEEEFTGRINFIKPALSTVSRTATVEILVSNPQNRILPGMYAHVEIAAETTEAVKIPLSAVLRQPGTAENFVFKLKNDTAFRIPIEIIASRLDTVFVKGIDKDIIVVTEGKNRLTNRTKVLIKD